MMDDVVSWLYDELNSALRELYIGLNGLTFEENFQSYPWEGTLTANEVRQITHPLRSVPRGYIIFKQIGNAVIDASTTAWDNDVVYLRNNSANSIELKVIFFK